MPNPSRQYQQISDETVIFRCKDRECYDGRGTPWFNKALNSMTDEQLAELDLRRYVAPAYVAPAPVLADVISQGEPQIDMAADEAMIKYVSTGQTQEARYIEKRVQAQAYKDAGYPADASAYPMVDLESQARGMTAQELAEEVLTISIQWVSLAANIEAIRVSSKKNLVAQQNIDPETQEPVGTAATAQAIIDNALATLGAI